MTDTSAAEFAVADQMHREEFHRRVAAEAALAAAQASIAALEAEVARLRNPLFPIAANARAGKEPCGECHINPGETCDICGALAEPKP